MIVGLLNVIPIVCTRIPIPTITITVKEGCYPRASKRESIGMLTSKSLACQSVPYVCTRGMACVSQNVEALSLTMCKESRDYEMALLRIYPSWWLNTDTDHTVC